LDGGCLDRRPAVLSTQIAALAADPTVPLPGDLGDRFLAAVPRLEELSTELVASAIPPTLVHGDLHAGNVMRINGRFVVFDWSDACVADPFVDVLMFLTRLPDDPGLRTTFRERYLDAWPGVTRSAADAYVELAEPLAAMHHAVSYRGIYDAFDPGDRWLFAGALPRWIEHALACPIVAG
jgi:aminoglycoside phosphotransferase (APT) family kinase protein